MKLNEPANENMAKNEIENKIPKIETATTLRAAELDEKSNEHK